MGFLVVVNPEAGADDRALVEEASRRLRDVRLLELGPGVDLEASISEAVHDDRPVIAAGGDGTANSVAQHLVNRGTLGILPAGTLNHFARDLGVGDPETALRALEAQESRRIDVGRVDVGGRDAVFLNNTGIGLYPELVREREHSEDRLGKWPAAVAGSIKVLGNAEPVIGNITADGDARAFAAWIVFVGNNRFSIMPGSMGERSRLDEGVLDVRVLTTSPRASRRVQVALGVLRGRAWGTGRLLRREAKRVRIDLSGRPRLVARDGETSGTSRSLSVEIMPGALTVLAPPR